MKTTLMFRKVKALTFFLIVSVLSSYAQKNFVDGFVITTAKDTLVGKLSNVHKNAHNFIDFLYPNGNDTVFTPNHIVAYEMGDDSYIVVPIPDPNDPDTTYLFAKEIVAGFASLYETKIKVDPITPAEVAYLCRKYDETSFHPAGKIKSLVNFFSDYPILHEELKLNHHVYRNNLETRVQLFNHYNLWKKHHLDSIKAANPTKAPVMKHSVEVYMADSVSLSLESKFELDKIAGKLEADPGLELYCEFLETTPQSLATKHVMKAVMTHLYQLDARINESVVSKSDGQINQTSKGQVILYYYK
jgi:hypothetical protein